MLVLAALVKHSLVGVLKKLLQLLPSKLTLVGVAHKIVETGFGKDFSYRIVFGQVRFEHVMSHVISCTRLHPVYTVGLSRHF